MMKTGKIGIYFLLIVPLLFQGCRFQDISIVSVDNIELLETTAQSSLVKLTLQVDNPNNKKIKISRADLDLHISGIAIGKAVLQKTAEIPKKGTFPVDLYLKIKFTQEPETLIASLGIAMLMGPLDLAITGNIKGSIGGFSKKYPVEHHERVSLDEILNLQ